jgi:hypothetical protein
MPVQFDKIDADIEIVPSEQPAPRRSSAGPRLTQASTAGEDVRRVIGRALRDELEELLRIRGR